MAQLGLVLTELFKRVGIENDPKVVELLHIGEVFKANIDDDIATKLQGGLMNEEIAKAKLRPIITAEALDGADNHLLRIIRDDLKMDSADIEEIKSGKVTGQKIELTLKKLIAKNETALAEAKKGAGKGDGKDAEKVQELTGTINELKTQLANAESGKTSAIEAERSGFAQKEMDYETRISLMKFVERMDLPAALTAKEKLAFAYNRVKDFAEQKGGKVVLINGRLEFKTAKDGTDFFDAQNRKVDYEALEEQAIAPILKKAPAPGQPGGGSVIVPGSQSPGDAAFSKRLNEQLQSAGLEVRV